MLDSFKESLLLYCYWVGDYLKRVLVIVSVSGFAISIAVSFYGAFYYAVLPSTATYIPLTFRFNSCDITGAPCSFISSDVKFEAKHFPPGLKYNLELVLEVPDNSANRELGMFLTCTHFISNRLDREPECVSSVLPFPPLGVFFVETFLLLPFILTRLVGSHMVTGIELVRDHEETVSDPTTNIELQIQTSKLQIHSGVLKVWTNDLTGIRYLMYHHPLASSIIGVASILTVTCLLGVLCLSKLLGPRRVVQAQTDFPRRTKSNADLADRQARARLTLQYRQELALRQQDGGVSSEVQRRSISSSCVSPPLLGVNGFVEGLGPVGSTQDQQGERERPKFE